LPPGSDGIVIVFENECNPTFTYRIDGPSVTYLGRGDHHDPKYDYLEVSSWLADVYNYSTRGVRPYQGIPLDTEVCQFFFRVFPSDDMNALYETNNRIYFTVVVILIFGFTSFLFFMYDYLVERRQKVVMKKAVNSSAIVSGLFPSQVRERLFENAPNDDIVKKGWKGLSRKTQITTTLESSLGCAAVESSRPIADLVRFLFLILGQDQCVPRIL
jgi:hypothetical protein